MNDGGGNGAGYFGIEEWADTTESYVNVVGLEVEKCSYLVGERQMFIKDEDNIASSVSSAEMAVFYLCILASCCLSQMSRNSVLEKLRISRLTAIQEEI